MLGLLFLLLIFIILILIPIHKKAPLKKTPPIRGRIAIVIDDWGYTQNNLAIVQQIRQPLTCAILPGLKNSNLIMQKLHDFGFEIILHLPMEPKEKYNLEKNTITVTMSPGQIRKIFDQDLSSVTLAKGVSNHMGSAVTEDKRAAELVILEAKRHNLYFFDSYVTSKSVCAPLAREIKIKFARRDIFLDNQGDSGYIKNQLVKLKRLARKQGLAVGIGHDRKNTLLVLKEMLPQIEAEGYEFVFLSQVVR